jgi:6-pyruvoyltetrahydropterin/6-carboxytetrahydropterin synthase
MFTESTIIKDYHFYTAHRNENLRDKCRNIHGHTYYLKIGLRFLTSEFNVESGIYLNFNDVDAHMEPLVKSLDHATLVSKKDSLLVECVSQYPDIFGKIVLMPEATSVENLTQFIANLIRTTPLGKNLAFISIKETTTSEVVLNF